MDGKQDEAGVANATANGAEHRRGFGEARKSEGLLKTSGNVNDEPARVTLS